MKKPCDARRRSSICSASYFDAPLLCVRLAWLTSGFVAQKLAGSPAASMLVRNVALLWSEAAAICTGVPVGLVGMPPEVGIAPARIIPTCETCVVFVQFVPVYCFGSPASDAAFPLKFAR